MNGPMAAALLLSLALVVLSVVAAAPARAGDVRRVDGSRWSDARGAGCIAAGARLCRRRVAAADDGPRCRGGGRNRQPALPSPPPHPARCVTRVERWKPRSMCSSVNCGWALIRCARSASPPTKPLARLPVSLRAVAARARLGADVAAGLRAAARSSALPAHWDRLAVCWQLASDHGLAIATLMRAAQRDIAERQRFSARVSSSMAGARATAAILAGLPVLGVLLGQLIGARPLSFLLGGHAADGCWWSGRRWRAAGCCGRTASPIGVAVVSTAAVLLAVALWIGAGPVAGAGACRDAGPCDIGRGRG